MPIEEGPQSPTPPTNDAPNESNTPVTRTVSVPLPDPLGPTATDATAAEGLGDDYYSVTRPKPFLAKALNNIGVQTTPSAEWLLDWVQVLAVAGLLAWVTMTFVIVRMRVPTGSMEPTIMPGDSFFVDKLSFYLRKPQPGDIVVFWHNESSGPVRYVKRLIAVAGQHVQIKGDCYVYIDGVALTSNAFNHPGHPNPQRQCYTPSGDMQKDEWSVPADKFFVLGDNTNNSLDSRYWRYADEKDFIGEPFLKVWPLNQLGFMNGYFGSVR